MNKGEHRHSTADPRPVKAGMGPGLTDLGLLAPGLEHWRGGRVGELLIKS